MKKYGGFAQASGTPTIWYLSIMLNRITWPGSLYLSDRLVPAMALAVRRQPTRLSAAS